jgi:hypothetical protein
MNAKSVFFFDDMLTPKIITFVYWLLLVGCVLGGLTAMFTTSFFAGLVGMVLGLVFSRIWCELLIVLFKMNDALQAIKNK